MKEKIKEYALSISIDDIGFTSYDLVKDKCYLPNNIPFGSNIDFKIMDEAKTIISIVMAYPNTCKYLENIKENEVYFSSSSWGMDYHKVLKEKLEDLGSYIKSLIPEFNYQILIDNHPLDDRYLAYMSGLGIIGKNNLLINSKYGSYIFIGNMLTNLDIESDYPLEKECLKCGLCINACPTKALTKNGYNYHVCLSYLTQKKELTSKEEKLLNNCIYGCDICSKVCPYNKKSNKSNYFNPSGIEFINVNEYKKLSNKEFKKVYGHLSSSWRGKKIIERNIDIYKEKIT